MQKRKKFLLTLKFNFARSLYASPTKGVHNSSTIATIWHFLSILYRKFHSNSLDINVKIISFQAHELLLLFHEDICADANYLRDVQLRGLLQCSMQEQRCKDSRERVHDITQLVGLENLCKLFLSLEGDHSATLWRVNGTQRQAGNLEG